MGKGGYTKKQKQLRPFSPEPKKKKEEEKE